MRRVFFICLIAWLLLLTSCSGQTEPPAGDNQTVPPVESTATSPESSAAPGQPVRGNLEPSSVAIQLAAIEAVAADDQPVTLRWADGVVHLTDTSMVTIDLTPGTVLSVGFEGGPNWEQVIDGPQVVLRQPWRAAGPSADPLAMAWQSGGNGALYQDQLDTADGLNVISPRSWTLDREGQLIGEIDRELVDHARARGIEVWPYITNGFDPARTALALATPENRLSLARELSAQAVEAGAAGVNVDFESFDRSDLDSFTDFVAKLSAELDGWGGVASVDITVLTRDFATAPESDGPIFDRRALAESADYLVLMAYDEHTTIRPFGPTASLDWTRAGIAYLLRFADPHQVILGVPLYTRRWSLAQPSRPGVIRLNEVDQLVDEATGRYPSDFGIDRVELPDGTFFWKEDTETLRARLTLAEELSLAGWAAWRLGFDSPEVWAGLTDP